MKFLDDRPLSLADPQVAALLEVLCDAWPHDNAPAIEAADKAGLPMARINWKPAMEQVIIDMLKVAADHLLMRRLVTVLVEQEVRVKELIAGFGVIPTQKPTPSGAHGIDPYEAHLVAGRRAVFDRRGLRTHLKDLCDPTGRRALLVRGPTQSGRSHTWVLVSHLGETLGITCRRVDMSVVLAVADEGPAGTIDPQEVADAITKVLGWDRVTPSDPTASPAKRASNLLLGVQARAADLAEPLILLVDGLELAGPGTPAHDLLVGLTQAAAAFELGPIRLVATDCTDRTAELLVRGAIEDDLDFPTTMDVRGFFVGAAEERGLTVTDGAVDLLMEELLGHDGRLQPTMLADVSERAGELAWVAFAEGRAT
ncbi:MAG TPA: hypothetical protein VF228_22795 [Iamia sp.]